ncbi:hypothetical protein [Methylocystis heyeri]|uniref:Radical SAM protein n=1 Tax=Methylocystis heyeri TaxID=391905 RepID=A0A6B8K8Q1_9HYPH|nr:hypothetical protein [Methylocystis heyeri]QGM44289.1 hypothetical protein H2LOC_000430 [Methylocystis heyeri]
MTRDIEIRGIRIFAKASACAHACAYCLIGPKKLTELPFPRFNALAERFIEWRNEKPNPPPHVLIGFEDSYEFDVEILAGLFHLYKKLGWDDEGMSVKLGGLRMRTEAEMHDWLLTRRDVAGLKVAHASLAGYGTIHDQWNRRERDFDFLYNAMRDAVGLGLKVNQRIFISRSTIASIDKLVLELDKITPNAHRYLSTFVYSGFATRLEAERITEEDRDRLPSSVAALPRRSGDNWLSEREWISTRSDLVSDRSTRSVTLSLEVNERNIDRLESMQCEEIIAKLAEQTRQAYATLPSRSELFEKYADPSNRCIYASMDEIERKWFDAYRRDYNFDVAKGLTHLAA